MLWNLLHFCLLQFCLCKSELVQIEVLPPFWAWLQLRDLLCSWGFHVKWTKIKNVKHSHPSTTGLAASSPGSPRSPGRWNRNLLKETLLETISLILFKYLCYETYCSPGGNTFLLLALSQQCKLRCSRRVEPNCISEIWSLPEDSWKQKEKKSEYKIFSPPHRRFGCKCSRIPKKPRKRESHVLEGDFVKSYSFGPQGSVFSVIFFLLFFLRLGLSSKSI